MKKLILLMCLLAVQDVGLSLSCYKCNGCENEWVKQETCRNVSPEQQNSVCLIQRIRVRDSNGHKDVTIRKCDIHDKSESYKCRPLPDSETISCLVCSDDLCNAATSLTTVYYGYICVFMLFFVPKMLYY